MFFRDRAQFEADVESTLGRRYAVRPDDGTNALTSEVLQLAISSAWAERLTVEEAALVTATHCYGVMKRERMPEARDLRVRIDVNIVELEVADDSWIRSQRLRDKCKARCEAALVEADAR